VSLLGYSLADYEALVEAFGDPDIDETAAMLYSTGDSALRALVAAAKGENPNGYVPPALANHPTVESDEFDIGWSVKALLDYVGSDEERALAVYVAEADKAEPRSTLVDKLGRMLGVDG
jgi:hypothetical protein